MEIYLHAPTGVHSGNEHRIWFQQAGPGHHQHNPDYWGTFIDEMGGQIWSAVKDAMLDIDQGSYQFLSLIKAHYPSSFVASEKGDKAECRGDPALCWICIGAGCSWGRRHCCCAWVCRGSLYIGHIYCRGNERVDLAIFSEENKIRCSNLESMSAFLVQPLISMCPEK